MKNNLIQSELNRAATRQVERGSFIARNYWLWIAIAWVVYPIAALWSAATAGGNIFLRLKIAAGDAWFVYALAGSIAVMIEVLKYFTGKTAIDDYQAGAWYNGGAERVSMLVKAVGFVAIMVFSVNLSLSGAKLANDYFREKFKPVETEAGFVDVSAVNARYDAQLNQHYKNIADYKKIQWRGVVTVPAQRMISREQRAIDKILAERESEVSRANSKNDATEAEHEAETLTNGNFLRGLAGVGEVIVIFCLIFIGIYDDGLRAEYEKKSGGRVPASGIGFRPAAEPAFSFNKAPNENVTAPAVHDFDLARMFQILEAKVEQISRNKPAEKVEQKREHLREQTAEQIEEQKTVVCSPVRTKKRGSLHNEGNKYRNLKRAVAMYKQRAVEGTLGDKGAATLARMEAELKRLKS